MPMPHNTGNEPLNRSAEPSLQALANHLSALTDSPTSLPMALAEATKGAAASEWKGLGLLSRSGSSIKDIATALSLFCSEYSTSHWADQVRSGQVRGVPRVYFYPFFHFSNCSVATFSEGGAPRSGSADSGSFGGCSFAR